MVVDSSAVLAILFNEPERDMFSDALADAGVRLMSSVNVLETAVVVSSRKGPHGAREVDLLLHRAEFEVVPFTADHLRLARPESHAAPRPQGGQRQGGAPGAAADHGDGLGSALGLHIAPLHPLSPLPDICRRRTAVRHPPAIPWATPGP